MKTILAPRASAILYNLLASQKQAKPWLLPANICPIVPITFMKAKIPFEFADISPESLHMDLDRAEARMKTREFGGLLYAHTYGEESTPDDFFARAKSLNPELLIVDDRCLCIPKFESESSADVVLFSTGYAKIVELEFGGYAFVREDVKYQPSAFPFRSEHLEDLEKKYKSVVEERKKFDYRDSDWLQTDGALPSWASYRLKIESRLESSLAQRKLLNTIYSACLPRGIQLDASYQTWRFNIRLRNKEQVLKAIFDGGFFASSHYASLAGIMSDGAAPEARRLAGTVINLFNDRHFNRQKAEAVCEIILENISD